MTEPIDPPPTAADQPGENAERFSDFVITFDDRGFSLLPFQQIIPLMTDLMRARALPVVEVTAEEWIEALRAARPDNQQDQSLKKITPGDT